jgi:DNA-binding CsgD family transcriptional regulator
MARLEIMLALASAGPAAAIAAALQAVDRFDLPGSSPRYAWPVVVAGAGAVLATARQAGVAHDERLRDQAAGAAEQLRTVAEKLESFGRLQQGLALTFAAADAQAGFLLADGPPAGAELAQAWDRAAAAWADLSEPYPLAEALLHAAETALACGDRDGAAERLQRAASLATDLGARPLSEEIAILARRARIPVGGESPAAAHTGAGQTGAGLTGRELEVLALVAAGRSNRDIAAELFISPKTASVHVSNILGKLGAANRGEAAAKAHALRLLESIGPA